MSQSSNHQLTDGRATPDIEADIVEYLAVESPPRAEEPAASAPIAPDVALRQPQLFEPGQDGFEGPWAILRTDQLPAVTINSDQSPREQYFNEYQDPYSPLPAQQAPAPAAQPQPQQPAVTQAQSANLFNQAIVNMVFQGNPVVDQYAIYRTVNAIFGRAGEGDSPRLTMDRLRNLFSGDAGQGARAQAASAPGPGGMRIQRVLLGFATLDP